MNIRRKWWSVFTRAETERTFASCVKEVKFYADQQWTQDFALHLLNSPNPKQKEESKGKGGKGWKGAYGLSNGEWDNWAS